MSKKLLAVIALVIASIFVFAGCSGDDYAFDALTNNPSATDAVQSNGGSFVQKGEYSYFVNGAEDGGDTNTFGTYHKGSIVRVKTSDLTKKDRVVETVVPKIIYAEEANSSGLYIFGDKIYYTTPNTGKDAQGNVQMQKLDFMMVNLDGTGTKLVATIDDNTQAFRFVEKAGKVYLLYVGTADITVNDEKTSTTAIYQVECESKQQTLVADNVDTVVFDTYANSASVAYTQKVVSNDNTDNKEVIETAYNNLYQFVAGSEKATLIKQGLDATNKTAAKFTPVALANNVVYYNSAVDGLGYNKSFNKYNGTSIKLANNAYDNAFVLSDNVILSQIDGYITKVTFVEGQMPTQQKICAQAEDMEFEYATSNHVYFSLTESYTLHRADMSKGELVEAEQVIIGRMQSTLWASYDFAVIGNQLFAFYFNDADEITYTNYLYASIIEQGSDELKYETKRIGLISENEQKRVIDREKDDKYAIEDFLA